VFRVGKTLVIAEKPSVARDLVGVLPGKFEKQEAYLEGEDYIVTYAVGHLVELINPEEYDPKYKKWRFDDLPIVPDEFKLQARDKKGEKQLKAIHKLMARDDVDRIVNACDAGREGELIFAYIYDTAKVKKPVERLWISSMTKQAIKAGFEKLRPGEELGPLQQAARSRSEADWLVGMNATRAATIRLRMAFDGAVSLGRVQTPTLALVARREEEIRAFKPEPYWLVEAQFNAKPDRHYSGRYLGGKRIPEDDAAKIVADCADKPGLITKLEQKEERELPQLLYDLTSLQRPREHAPRVLGPAHPLGRAEALRGAQGDHLPEDELALPHRRPRRGDPPDRGPRRREQPVQEGLRLRRQAAGAPARPGRQRREGDGPPRDHPDALGAQPDEDEGRRAQDLRPRREALPRDLPPGGRLRRGRASRRPSTSTSSARAVAC